MEDATKTNYGTASERRPRPLLAVEQQIAHMKSKSITFDLVSEADAAAHLRTKCQFFRIYAYRELFDKHEGGAKEGQYIGLDFGHLKALSNLDRMLRDVLLPMHDARHRALHQSASAGSCGRCRGGRLRRHARPPGFAA